MTDPIDKYMQEFHNTPEYEKSILRDLWHYPSRGEYPKEDEEVLCELLDGTHEVGKYCPSKYKEYQEYEPPWDFGDYLEDYIECWQYIVPPKEEK